MGSSCTDGSSAPITDQASSDDEYHQIAERRSLICLKMCDNERVDSNFRCEEPLTKADVDIASDTFFSVRDGRSGVYSCTLNNRSRSGSPLSQRPNKSRRVLDGSTTIKERELIIRNGRCFNGSGVVNHRKHVSFLSTIVEDDESNSVKTTPSKRMSLEKLKCQTVGPPTEQKDWAHWF